MKQKLKLISAVLLAGIGMATISTAQTVTGSGTINYVTKFTSTGSTIGNSVLQESATNIGVGYAPGSYKLDVNGHINIVAGSAYKIGGSSVVRTNGSANIFLGDNAGTPCIGGFNTFVGTSCGFTKTTGDNNTFVGFSAGANTAIVNTGWNNTFIGSSAGGYTTTGNENVCVGKIAGAYNNQGTYNTIVGNEAGLGVINTSNYSYNSFFGYQAGLRTTTGNNNVFMGYKASSTNSTGSNNISIGYSAGYSNATNSSNIAIGTNALFANVGYANIAVGSSALESNTSGGGNLAIGFAALAYNTAGASNTACGYQTLYFNTGDYNTGYGNTALYKNSTGYRNNGFGVNALFNTTTGYSNTAIGFYAGYANITGYNNTAIGNGADVSTGTLNNAAAIGNGAIVTLSSAVQLGNSATTNGVYAYGPYNNISDGRFKTNVQEAVKGLAFINKLRPVTYQLNINTLDDFIIQNMSDSIKSLHKNGMDFVASATVTHSGFIAQEVELAAQQVGFTSSIVHHPANSSDPYALAYAEIVVPLVKAVQELSKTVDSLKTAMNACCHSQAPRSMQQSPASDSQTTTKQTDVELINKNVLVLDQNVPNPFAEQTTINYYLPDNVTRAQIIFFDQSNKIIKAVDLTEKGKGTLNIFANDLSNGIYTYSLIIDGQTVETKKMVKAK